MAKESPWGSKPGAAETTFQEPDMKKVKRLAEEAAALLNDRTRIGWDEDALWRLVDAAGTLSRYVDDDAVGQKRNPTGEGYYIGSRY